jgi:hypothetical protein
MRSSVLLCKKNFFINLSAQFIVPIFKATLRSKLVGLVFQIEDGTRRLFRTVRKKLPLIAA